MIISMIDSLIREQIHKLEAEFHTNRWEEKANTQKFVRTILNRMAVA